MKKLTILLVEDNIQDAFLIKEALEERDFLKKIYHVENGAKALDFLKNEHPYKEVEAPNLILMDINMPVMDGLEALKRIKSDPDCKHIPVLILTTSSRKEDILNAYKEHSNSYLVKPDDIFELDKLTESIKNYWMNVARLPD